MFSAVVEKEQGRVPIGQLLLISGLVTSLNALPERKPQMWDSRKIVWSNGIRAGTVLHEGLVLVLMLSQVDLDTTS